MADFTDPTDSPVDFGSIGEQFASGAMRAIASGDVAKFLGANATQQEAQIKAFALKSTTEIAAWLANHWEELEGVVSPLIGAFVAPIIVGLFGGSISAGELTKRLGAGGGAAVAGTIVDGYMRALAGDGAGEIEPSPDGARRIATAAVQATFESELNALIPEIVSMILPEVTNVKDLLTIPDSIIRALGVSRLVRGALTPLVNATARVPMQQYVNKLYTPTLLSPGIVTKQVARQRWSLDDAREELARQGYDDDAIEALMNDTARFLTVADVWRLVRANQWDEADAAQHLNDQGYDDDTATNAILLERMSAIESFERSMADAAVDGYVNGRIDSATLSGGVQGATLTPQESAQYVELASARRTFGAKDLTSSEAETLALAGILAASDYRDALTRENRTEPAIEALELLLRQKMDTKASLADLKAQQAADKAAKQAAADAAALAKKTAADAAAAVKALGPAADIEQAYIRGLVPIGRLSEIYAAKYGGDTADVLVALAQAKRDDYTAAQAARAAITTTAAGKGLSIAQLDAAVTAGVITMDDYTRRLTAAGLSADDAAVITSTLQAKIAATQQEQQLHADAAAKAAAKSLSLAQMEQLVRAGHRSMADYDAFLQGLGYDDASRAGLEELLQDAIDAAAAAVQARATIAAGNAAKGLSLDQARRAVILGQQTADWFQTFLVAQGYAADAQTVLVAEVRQDAADADVARQRRAAADAKVDASRAPLADVARAARLGLVTIDVYVERLKAAGYTDDDVAIETDLLSTEIADDRATQAAADAADAAATAKGLNLAQVAAVVVAGIQPIGAYAAALTAAGFTADAAAALVALEQSKLDAATAATARRDALDARAATASPTIAEEEAGVINNLITQDDYVAFLQGRHYDDDDIGLLVGLLQVKLDAKAAKAPA